MFTALLLLLATLMLAHAAPIRRQAPPPPSSTNSTSGNPKLVVAHVIVGNTYAFTPAAWAADMQLAQGAGIDGFALNVGSDSWQPGHVADAYAAAKTLGTGFKLFMSFDMSVLGCNDAAPLRTYITTYAGHPNQLTVDGKVFASTFAGESCTFGQGSVADGWRTQFTQHPDLTGAAAVHFVPSFFVDPATFGSYAGVMDGAFNFNSGWPIELDVPKAQSVLAPAGLAAAVSGAPVPSGLTADAALAPFAGNTTTDDEYRAGLAKLPAGGGTYMAAASPWFFTHYGGALNKNFMYLGDNHLYTSRWENLVATRDSVDIVEIVSFNDYGESHYLKDPTEFDAMPPDTTWVPGMSHQGWLDMTAYYAAAFKTGVYPTVQEDALYVWARPHARTAAAAADALPPPTSFELTQDAAWAVVLATAPGVLTLTTGGTTQSYNVSAGANKLAQALSPGDTLRATLTRADATVLDLTPNFTFQGATDTYNYNAFVAYAKTNSSAPSS